MTVGHDWLNGWIVGYFCGNFAGMIATLAALYFYMKSKSPK